MLDPGADQLLKEEIANASIMGVAGNLFSMDVTTAENMSPVWLLGLLPINISFWPWKVPVTSTSLTDFMSLKGQIILWYKMENSSGKNEPIDVN